MCVFVGDSLGHLSNGVFPSVKKKKKKRKLFVVMFSKFR